MNPLRRGGEQPGSGHYARVYDAVHEGDLVPLEWFYTRGRRRDRGVEILNVRALQVPEGLGLAAGLHVYLQPTGALQKEIYTLFVDVAKLVFILLQPVTDCLSRNTKALRKALDAPGAIFHTSNEQ
jgi:hypothetical protein